MRSPYFLCLLVLACLIGCGGAAGTGDSLPGNAPPGTVSVLNQSDMGMAPLVVEQFFFEPVTGGEDGAAAAVVNRLNSTIPPGGIVILGLFPAGLYNATAVLEGGANINWVNEEVRPGQPKNFVIP